MILVYEVDRLLDALSNPTAENSQFVTYQIKNTLEMPLSTALADEIMMHPFILVYYIESLQTNRSRERALSVVEQLRQQYQAEDVFVRVRKFSSQGGPYFGIPFDSIDGAYSFWHLEPVLITRLTKEFLEEPFFKTELGWISRPEIRLIASLLFSVPCWHGPAFYFQPQEITFDLPASLVMASSDKITQDTLERAQIAVDILSRIRRSDFWRDKSTIGYISPYRFRDQGIDLNLTRKFYDNFDITNNLLLRTAFLLIKSAMLWQSGNRLFGEEAAGNLFFGLEGCLRLIHKRASANRNFEIKTALQHVQAIFPQKPGYEWMLEDVYKKRIQIAHPEPKNHFDWLPDIAADDFFENYGMANDFMYYIVTGEVLPEHV